MTDDKYKNITDPTDLGFDSLDEFISKTARSYKDINLLNNEVYNVDESVNLKGEHTRLMIVKDYIGIVNVNRKDKKVSVRFGLGGVPVDCAEVETVFNNRTGEPSITKYEIPIKQANSEKIKLAIFDPEKIYDNKEFRKETGCLCNLNPTEVLEFIKQETEDVNKSVTEFTNCGRIDFYKNDWLWGNKAFINGKLATGMDEYRNIKINENQYIRAQKRVRRKLPMYYHNAKPISKVLTDLFDNVNSAWNGAVEPPSAICYMSLSAFCNRFWTDEGFGIVGFIGETEGGKTEICNLACGIYGCDKSFFSGARSTVVGIEQVLNAYNCIPCVIDDISRYRLSGDNFIDMLKQISIGGQKDKGKNGQESGALPPCSPLVFTSNVMPAEKPEIFNRMLFLNADNLNFSPENFKYFGKAREELSCILPHILKYSPERFRSSERSCSVTAPKS